MSIGEPALAPVSTGGEAAREGGPAVGADIRTSDADRRLVSEILAGDEAAFARLVETHHGSLVRLARSFVADHGAAEEVVQETWMAVLEGLARFEGRSALKTWIFRILTNRAKTRGVRDARQIPFSALFDTSDPEPAVDPARFRPSGMWSDPPREEDWGLDARLVRRETFAFIESAIRELPASQQIVVTMRDIEGLSSLEVCALLEISEVNQRVLLHRGRSKLRNALERYLGEGKSS